MQLAANATVFSAVSLFCFGVSLFGTVYAFYATLRIRGFVVGATKMPQARPSVTLLKPLCGTEPNLSRALSSFCDQIYEGPVQVVFGVQSADDAAIAVVEELRLAYPDRDIDLVVDGTEHGTNRKVSNLINMSARIRHDLVVLADSDIVVEPDYLSAVVDAFGDPRVGVVTCLYRGLAGAGVWSRLTALAINLHFMPGVLVGVGLKLARPCFGSTIALRRETLIAVGGFMRFADQLADDYEMGAAVRELGLTMAIPPIVVGHLCQDASFKDLWRHELRWARTVRLVDPIGFVGSGATHPLPLALLGLLVGGLGPFGLAVAALAFLARLCVAASAQHAWSTQMPEWSRAGDGPKKNGGSPAFRAAAGDFCLLILRDMMSFAIFVASFFAFQVRWRDFDYQIASNGVLSPLKENLDDANAVSASSVF